MTDRCCSMKTGSASRHSTWMYRSKCWSSRYRNRNEPRKPFRRDRDRWVSLAHFSSHWEIRVMSVIKTIRCISVLILLFCSRLYVWKCVPSWRIISLLQTHGVPGTEEQPGTAPQGHAGVRFKWYLSSVFFSNRLCVRTVLSCCIFGATRNVPSTEEQPGHTGVRFKGNLASLCVIVGPTKECLHCFF